jgi:hypothetical protein
MVAFLVEVNMVECSGASIDVEDLQNCSLSC